MGKYMKKLFRIQFFGSQSDNRKSKIQNRKLAGLSMIVCVLVMTGAVAQAQQPAKMPRVGILFIGGAINHTLKHSSKDFESVATPKAKISSSITATRKASKIAFLRLRLNWFS